LSGVTLPPYRIGVRARFAGQNRPSALRISTSVSATIGPLALRPVPIAHTGSYAITSSVAPASASTAATLS
jgi:hypothetical protein